MIVGAKIRLKPNKEQERQFNAFADAARFTYNECLAYKIQQYEETKDSLTVQECYKHMLALKYTTHKWLDNIPSSVIEKAISDLDIAFLNFYNRGYKGFPRFKKKDRCKRSFSQRVDRIRQIDETHIKITGIKTPVKCNKFVLSCKVYNARVSYDGKYWYLGYGYDVVKPNITKTDEVLGIDLGIKNLAVVSDGRVYQNINKTDTIKRLEERRNRLKKQVSRKYEINKQGNKFIKTNNIKKLEQRIRLIDRRISNIRDTYIHTVTMDLVRTKPKTIVIEDLNVSALVRNKHISKAIHEQCFNKFREYLTYKCEFYGTELKIADRFYPSSQLCHSCGYQNTRIKNLNIRYWICPKCNTQHDRDFNASLNLKALA